MKKIITLSFLICFSIGFTFAQTKLISHKSHSGSLNNFKIALEDNRWDMAASDFGEAPRPDVHYSVLDSLVFVNDSLSVMWTSDYCSWWGNKDTTKWAPGSVYLNKHPLFSKQHALDSIKSVLDSTYNFKNKANSVVFKGYDNLKSGMPAIQKPSKKELRKARKEAKKKARKERKMNKKKLKEVQKTKPDSKQDVKPARFIPVVGEDPKDPPAPFGIWKILLIGFAGLLAVFIGYTHLRFSDLETVKA